MPQAEPTGCPQHELEWPDNRDAADRDAADRDAAERYPRREVAMATVMKSTTIPASVDAVWAVLADFAAISQWAPNVDHSCLMSDQTEGVGMVRRIQTGRTTVVERVEHWEPGAALRVDMDNVDRGERNTDGIRVGAPARVCPPPAPPDPAAPPPPASRARDTALFRRGWESRHRRPARRAR